jgi:hypothetical protein
MRKFTQLSAYIMQFKGFFRRLKINDQKWISNPFNHIKNQTYVQSEQ